MNNANNRWLSILTIILLIANMVTLGILWSNHKTANVASDKEASPFSRPGQAFEFLTKELALTQQQQDAYKTLRDEHRAGQRSIQDSIRIAKDAFFELLKMPAVTDAELQQASNKSVAFQQQLDLLTFKHFQKVRALCKPDQQKKFDEIIKQVLRQMAGAGRRQGPPPGARREDGPPPPGKEGEHPDDMPPPPGKK